MKALRSVVIVAALVVAALPLVWMFLTSIKSREDAISPRAKVVPFVQFQPTLRESYLQLGKPLPGDDYSFFFYLANSAVIGLVSTIAAVALGTCCAYGFSRFRVAGAQDWLFFILSTRFLPPLAVVFPILLMYRELELPDTHLGMILLYTVANLSLAVWLMKGFIDEIPRAYEEAALVDGYSRLQAFFRIILPQAATGMAVTAVFCLISAWNEYGFAVTLTTERAKTVPVYFAGLGYDPSGIPWPQIAAGTTLFVVPILVFTILVRKHLLRGVTFGTVKQ
jgi:multiple sugar transport system permease protein